MSGRWVIPNKVGGLRESPCTGYGHHDGTALPLQVEYTTPLRRSLDREQTHWYRVYLLASQGPFIMVRGGRLFLSGRMKKEILACVV